MDGPREHRRTPLIDYVVEYCEGTLAFCTTGGGTWTSIHQGSTATTASVGGLTNGTVYQFQVRAENAVGVGEAGASVDGKPRTVPNAPTGLAATPGNGQVALTWVAPAFDGGMPVTDYVVQYRTGGGAWSTFPDGTSTNLFATVNGLTNGLSYEFQVLAHNVAGDGAPSTSVFRTPRTVPGAPTLTSATPGNQQVILRGKPPRLTAGPPSTTTRCNAARPTAGTRRPGRTPAPRPLWEGRWAP